MRRVKEEVGEWRGRRMLEKEKVDEEVEKEVVDGREV